MKSQTSLDGVVRLVRDVNPSVSGVIGGSTSATGVTGVVISVLGWSKAFGLAESYVEFLRGEPVGVKFWNDLATTAAATL